jgi:erythromycin esterase
MDFEYYQNRIAEIARPLEHVNDLDPLIEKIKHKKIVMLGESSHGTHEFYEWRRIITQKLIAEHGFNLVAIEADWPACEVINQCVRHQNDLEIISCLQHFTRWPTWMWANREMESFIAWLKQHNAGLKPGDRRGIHGLDLYSIFESIDEVIGQLEKIDAKAARQAREAYAYFAPFCKDEVSYVRSLVSMSEERRQELLEVLISTEKLVASNLHAGELLNIRQNARVVANAERYYAAMINADDQSWNIREQHMMDTLEQLLDCYGKESKAVVWEHNSHVGDLSKAGKIFKQQVNLGSLAREKYGGPQVALVGLATYKGMVTASNAWEGAIMELPIPIGRQGSLEDEFHLAIRQIGHSSYYVLLDEETPESALNDERGHRAIGAVYHPGLETKGSYSPTLLCQRYDAFIFIDETTPVRPLEIQCDRSKIPETYPFNDKI